MTNAAVGREDLERQLEVVRALAPGEMEGVFGPDSLTWRINREALIFLGGGRALLLQLAHPWVAAAIAETGAAGMQGMGKVMKAVTPQVAGRADGARVAAEVRRQLAAST